MNHKFELIAASFTPMDTNGEIDFSKIQHIADWFIKNSIDGVFVNGTTGEGVSLTTEERILLSQEWAKASADKLKVIVHVGHNSLYEAKKMAGNCEKLNVDGSLTFFF